MNGLISKIGAAIVSVTVFLFAVFLIIDYTYASYFVCMFLPLGYIMMAAGFHNECSEDRKVAANIGMVLSAVYTVLILSVYFAQTTSVRLEIMTAQAERILNYKYGSLFFNYDLLGYGMMALSTFFIGLSLEPATKQDKWLKALMLIHGIFFLSCFFMPMTGLFLDMSDGSTSNGGAAALVAWCAFFLPIGILSFIHFNKKGK